MASSAVTMVRPHRCDSADPTRPRPSTVSSETTPTPYPGGLVGLALAVGRGVRGCAPEPLQLVVEEHQGEGTAGHVQARDELADLGLDHVEPLLDQEPGDAAPDDEELLVLRRSQSVQDGSHPVARACRLLGQHPGYEAERKL